MIRAPRVAGIILAAGSSSRMGRPKQLLPLRGQTIIECVVDSALASPLDKVVVVLGHRAEKLIPLLREREVTVVINAEYQSGQSSSLQAGLRVVGDDFDAALFLLADQPLITPSIISSILTAYANNPSPIVLPLFDGKRGNPVLFDRQTFDFIDSLSGDTGGRVLFQKYAGQILEVPVQDIAIHFDIDTEKDYSALRKME
jgi:molybdenum cofactor cytidylyltransferase